MSEYDVIPQHPLNGVPAEVLAAARSATADAAEWNDIDPDAADPLADAVLASALPAIRSWLADALEDRAGALRTNDFRTGKAGIEYINGVEYAAHYVRDAPKPDRTFAGHPLTCNGGNPDWRTHHDHEVILQRDDKGLFCPECGRRGNPT